MEIDAGHPEPAGNASAQLWETSRCEGVHSRGAHIWRPACRVEATPYERGMGGWHTSMQRTHVAQAVLLAMRGTYGAVIHPASAGPGGGDSEGAAPPFALPVFEVSSAVHPELRGAVQPLLRICEARALLWRTGKYLTATYSLGLINQAFGAALLDVCLGTHEMVCDIWEGMDSTGQMSDPINYVLQASLAPSSLVSLLADVVVKWGEGEGGLAEGGGTASLPHCLQGAAVLCLLEECREASAPRHANGVSLITGVIDCASRPFLSAMRGWLYRGQGSPAPSAALAPFSDLPIAPPPNLGDAGGSGVASVFPFMSWRIDPASLPRFAQGESSNAEKLLESGQLALYLAESGLSRDIEEMPLDWEKNGADADEMEVDTALPLADYVTFAVHDAWGQMNSAVLSTLWGPKVELRSFLQFIHTYYLCGDATWVTQFIERCGKKPQTSLNRASREVSWHDIHCTLSDVLFVCDRSDSKVTSRFSLAVEPARTQLFRSLRSGGPGFASELPIMATLQLRAEVPTALQLLFTEEHQLKYNFIFRLLFRLKALKADLAACRRGRRDRVETETVYLLHAMRSLVDSLESYICFEVIEPLHAAFLKRAEGCTTVSSLCDAHSVFLHRMLELCLAFNEPCLKLLEKALLSVKLFSEAATRSLNTDMLNRFGVQYMDRLQAFMQDMSCRASSEGGAPLQALHRRLDFNGFYARQRRKNQEQGLQA